MNYHNTKGVWRLHIWPKISEMTELYLFRMSFPEQWVRDFLSHQGIEVDSDNDPAPEKSQPSAEESRPLGSG